MANGYAGLAPERFLERAVSDRFTGNPGIAAYPVWSPDGSVIVFSTGSPLSLFRKAASGVGAEERLTQSPSLQPATDWSRDGRLLYFVVGPNTQEDIWTVPVTADGRRIPGAEPKPYIPRRRFASLTPASRPGRIPLGLPICLTSLVSSRSIPTPFQSLDTKSAFHREGACIRSGVMPETNSFMSRRTTR